ncbi:formimidoylglutamate deiminase [Microlunatus speluncae]|uniref:formimidoylglutamate deiminase n=1 Tax=Microlunatus speluncae TaxID=2594267 RepID=UPI00126647A2|nr:formimidoylglutamate deiminase [Microlunatus speluncae]
MTASTGYWAEHAFLPDGWARRVRFEVVAGRFGAVITDADPEPADDRLPGVVLPGLANAHSHAFHRALRGRTQGGRGSFWTWREAMYRLASRLDPDNYLALARVVYTELALAGYTAVGEFHYLHHDQGGRPYADPNAMGLALITAAEEVGIRITLLDTCYLAGGLEPNGHRPLDPVQQRFSDGDVERWQSRVAELSGTPLAKIGSAAHSVRAVPAHALGPLAEAFPHAPLHLHLSEQPAENDASVAHYGRTPTRLVDEHGLLGTRTTAVHATHLTGDDIDRLGRSGTAVCFCPTTERDLADGVGPGRELLDAGSPLCLGSDQHAVIDPFEELRGLELNERLITGERGRFGPEELITAAGPAGHRSLGWDEAGRIAVGAAADFVVIGTDSVRTAGCDPEQLHYAATTADVRRVVVGGVTLVVDGEHRDGTPDLAVLDRLWEER